MSKLSELRKRSKATRDMQKEKVERVKNSVLEVASSSSFALSAINHLGECADAKEMDEFALEVATKAATAALDVKGEFIDLCRARGMNDEKIRKAVYSVNELFQLTDSDDFEECVEAVALYLSEKPTLYDDIALLS